MRAALPWLGLLLCFLVLRTAAGWPRGVASGPDVEFWLPEAPK